jgi:LmbE family N-acetylglucosaminyl deacetylase
VPNAIDVMVIGAHPDDAEIGAGGLLALCKARGLRTGVLVLTRGEGGAWGDPATRAAEARAASALLGVSVFHQLDLGDTRLDAGDANTATVEQLLLDHPPRLLVTHTDTDWNPDHRAAWVLAERAWARANRARLHGEAAIERPRVLQFAIDPRRALRPALVIDISEVWSAKLAALAAHATQAPVIDSIGVEAVSRWAGSLIGVERGEAFTSPEPVALDGALALL